MHRLYYDLIRKKSIKYNTKDHINEPTPRPHTNHVISLRVLFDIMPKNSCNNRSTNIIINNTTEIYQTGRAPKIIRKKATTCQIVDHKHLAHIFMRFQYINKHLSGMP